MGCPQKLDSVDLLLILRVNDIQLRTDLILISCLQMIQIFLQLVSDCVPVLLAHSLDEWKTGKC